VLTIWALAAAAGAFAWAHLNPRLSGSVEVPDSGSQVAARILREDFGESARGSFVVLFEAPAARWGSARFVAAVETAIGRAARVIHGRPSSLRSLNPEVSYAGVATELTAREAQERVGAVEAAIGHPLGSRTKVTGFPVISAEVSATIADDLHRAELIALPVTALILLIFFGSLPAAAIPLLFGLATISVAMGVVWLETLLVSVPVYATNVVTLVGIALAVDYSMLYVARYREELRKGDAVAALPATGRTAGRALTISGAVVAAGLVPLAFVPIPFFSGLGLATVAIPVVSVLAAVTLLPALLEILAPRLQRQPLRPRWRRRPGASPLAERLVDLVMRRAGTIAIAAGALMLAVALPATALELTGGSGELSRRAVLPGSDGRPTTAPLVPYEVLVERGRAGIGERPCTLEAERRLLARLIGDAAVRAVQAPVEAHSCGRAGQLGLLDPDGRFARIRVSGTHPSGSPGAEALVERLRSDYLPRAGLGPGQAWVGGPAAADYDFVRTVEASVPVLLVVIVVLMYVLLTVLLRSPVLPLKAILMSALSVAAACGVMVMVFQFGWAGPLSPAQPERIVAWVPVFLFAALFGISTDYEIFMVTRMREEWLRSGDNERAVRIGLRLVGGMITASALVMLVIFGGFAASRVASLQQFGVALVSGVFFDATVVRLLLVPSLMKLMGRWNWSFPLAARSAPTDGAVRWPDGR
jgi:RND superfamily putative drug exporter